ncbi:rust resistance kinase Lr10-like [Forsythia ovata]|uniref:Rust resistance kinase Lr10-like n=1 Tax=Forsythia ovata TaxID=205694 RepID=A0ABD1WQT3_9LAMI
MSDDRGASITRTATTWTATERQSPEQRGPGNRGESIGGGRVNGGSPALVISRAKKWGRFLESGGEREMVRNEGRNSGQNECLPTSCDSGPIIRFPFRLKDHQPAHCGYLGFELLCINSRKIEFENFR